MSYVGRPTVSSLLGVLLLLVVSACSDGDASPESDEAIVPADAENGFVGAVDGTDAFVAVVAGEDDTVAYVCNGQEEIAEYFWGSVDAPVAFELTSLSGVTMNAEFVDGSYAGTVTGADGATHSFDTVQASGDAGLYVLAGDEAEEAGVAAGWVLDNDGNERGAFVSRTAFESTPELDTSGVQQGGTTFTVKRISVSDFSKTPSPGGPIPIPYPNTGTVSR